MNSSLETISCDLCGGRDTTPVWRVSDRLLRTGEEFSVVRCVSCGLVFVNPRPTRDAYMRYYPDDYLSFVPTRGISRLFRRVAAAREIKMIRCLVGIRPRLLEVGAGSGEDLVLLKEKLGGSLVGTETSSAARVVAEKHFSVNLLLGDLERLRLPAASFDYVRIKYVLGHVPSPASLLREVARVLRPGGYVALWVPNFNSWGRKAFGNFWQGGEAPRHLFNFTPSTLRRYLASTGFELVSCRGSIVPNTWIHSARVFLAERRIGRLFSPALSVNPFSILLFLPLSVVAYLFRQSDRLFVLARRKTP